MTEELQIYGRCPNCGEFKKLDTRYFENVYCKQCGEERWDSYNNAVAEATYCGYL